jgi:hypothetical protein
VSIFVSEDFKDEVIEIDLVCFIGPLLDSVIAILFQLNQKFDTFIWEAII